MKFILKEKDDTVSWEEIQNLLSVAHKTNSEKGLFYSAENQTVEQLKNRADGGITYTILDSDADNRLVATYTIKKHKINHWYTKQNLSNEVFILILLAVDPEYRGMGLANMTIENCIDYARKEGIEVIILDTAEENIAMKNHCIKYGFKAVDCCNWAVTNYISVVYAKWIFKNCPYSDEELRDRYNKKRKYIIENNIINN